MCAGSCLGLALLVFISIIFGSINSFIEHQTSFAIIAQYLVYSLPQIIYMVLPFSVCLGVIATQAQFSRHLETIAMQACSVSFSRMSIPYLCVGVIAVILMSMLSFSLYPKSEQEANKLKMLYIKKHSIMGSFSVSGGRFRVGNDIFNVENLDVSKGYMQNITCYRIRSGKLSSIIRAKTAQWDGKKWNSTNMSTINMSASGINYTSNTKWLPLSHGPTTLVMAEPRPEVLTITELMEYRERLKEDGIKSVSLETQFHSRISFNLAPFIMTVLVIPFGLRFPRAGGIARGISIGIILGLSYWAIHSVMIGVGISGYLNPALAAWGSDIFMLCAAIFINIKRRTAYD